MYRQSLEIRLKRAGRGSAEYAETLNNLGVLLKNRGDLDGAREALQEALATRRAVLVDRAADLDAVPTDVREARTNVATTPAASGGGRRGGGRGGGGRGGFRGRGGGDDNPNRPPTNVYQPAPEGTYRVVLSVDGEEFSTIARVLEDHWWDKQF